MLRERASMRYRVWILLIAAPACLPAQDVAVESGKLRAVFHAQTGDLASLGEPGVQYLAPSASPLFQLQVARSGGATEWLDARAAKRVTCEDDGQGGLRLTFLELRPGLDARATVRPEPESESLLFGLQVANGGTVTLEHVVFPLLRARRPLGEEARDDQLFVPGGDGYVAGPEAIERQRWQRRQYPGPASMQCASYYDVHSGLSLICRDARGRPKLIGAGIGDDFVDLSIWFQCAPSEPGFGSPWIAVSRASGSWTAAARQYAAWARKQWWAEKQTGGDATPDWAWDGPLVLSADFRPLGNGRMFVPLDRVVEFARVWQDALEARSVLVEWRNWEHDGYYTSPFYFPLYPSQRRVASVLGDLRAAGHRSQAMVAGLKWMVDRQAYHTPHYNVTAFDGRRAFEEHSREACVIGQDGQPLVEKAYFTWDGDHAYICPGTVFAEEHFRRTARELAAAGFDLFEFDQMNGGGCPPCYSRDHGHPPGPGPWIAEAIAGLMRITRDEGRLYNPDFALSMEDPGELYLPVLDTYISRVNDVIGWPAVGPGSEVVPAFAHVYGDLLPSTNVDIQHTSRPDEMIRLRTARAFIAGAGLSTQLTPWQVLADYGEDDLLPTPDKMDGDQLTLLRNCVRTRNGHARDYFRSGGVWPLRPTVPRRSVEVQYQTGTTSESAGVEHPSAMGSCAALEWRGMRLLVNWTTEPVVIRNAFPWGRPARFFLNDDPVEPLVQNVLDPLTVPPLSTVMAEDIDAAAPWTLKARLGWRDR